MHKLDIKPLSVNQAYTGRRYKTKKYKNFKKHLLWILPPIDVPKKGKLKLCIEWGFSNESSDNTNPIKPFEDVLQERYGFDDKRVYDTRAIKKIVPKGKDYIKFQIKPINYDNQTREH